MSIIGGSKNFSLNDELETNFLNGITAVVSKSGIEN